MPNTQKKKSNIETHFNLVQVQLIIYFETGYNLSNLIGAARHVVGPYLGQTFIAACLYLACIC